MDGQKISTSIYLFTSYFRFELRRLVYDFHIDWNYYSAMINKAELVEDNLQTPKRGNLIRDLNLRQLRQKFVGGALATVAFDVVQGSFVPLLSMGGTGVGDQRNQIPQVACVTHR